MLWSSSDHYWCTPGLSRPPAWVTRQGTASWEDEEEDGNEAKQTHLHCVGFSCPCLPIGKDADIVAINAGGDQGLNLLKHLRETGESEEKLPPLLTPAVWTVAPTSSWDACGGKTLSSSKDTCFPLCRRYRTASSSASKVTALAASGPSPSSFVMGRTRPKTRMFPWRREAGSQPSNTGWAEASCSQPNHLMGTLPCPFCPASGTPYPAHL